jgi:hypothetical protein
MHEHAWIFINNYLKISLLGILYNAIMHKEGFGQAYFIDLPKRTPTKFIWFFSKFSTNLCEFWKFAESLNWIKWNSKIEKD